MKPKNQGGGRQPKTPSAKFYDSGQLTLSHAAVAMLGDPRKVSVKVEPDLRRFRLYPATPQDGGAFALSGGGNSPHRLALSSVGKEYPQMVGAYRVVRIASGVECIQEDTDKAPGAADGDDYTW
ncbi:MAG: hypothetical protein WBC13_00880 [Dokdonella sp.]